MQKVTLESIEALIVKENYWNNGKSTICILTLENGFEVIGTAGIVDKTNFDEEIGKKFAKEKAIEKMWELEGYRLQWNNYYTPTPEEFHIGFEFEIKLIGVDDGREYWEKNNFPDYFRNQDWRQHLQQYINSEKICVKHLDQADIENLGWEWAKAEFIHDGYKLGDYELIPSLAAAYGPNVYVIYMNQGPNKFVKFSGTIKNKSELKKLMRQIGIHAKS